MYKLDVDRKKLLGHLSIISTEEDRCHAQLSTYSSLHLSLLFIPTTNFTAVYARVEE